MRSNFFLSFRNGWVGVFISQGNCSLKRTINVKARYNVLEYIDFHRDYDTLLSNMVRVIHRLVGSGFYFWFWCRCRYSGTGPCEILFFCTDAGAIRVIMGSLEPLLVLKLSFCADACGGIN